MWNSAPGKVVASLRSQGNGEKEHGSIYGEGKRQPADHVSTLTSMPAPRSNGDTLERDEPLGSILIVDDEPHLRRALSIALTRGRYRVEQAGSAEEAIRLLEKQRFQVILSDLNMPGMSGIDFLREVHRRYRSTPLVIMTGYASVETAVEAARMGVHDYLIKPFDNDEMLRTIEGAMEKGRREARYERLERELVPKDQRLARELEHARAIQASFLPREKPVLPGYEVDALYRPAYEVSGDFYDFYRLDDRRLGMVVGDVAGKGVGAALLMARLTGDFREIAAREHEPTRVLQAFNERLMGSNAQDAFATLIYVQVEIPIGNLALAGAGHPRPFLMSGGGALTALECGDNGPLGTRLRGGYTQNQYRMRPGDMLLLLTDGVIEARNARGEMYGPRRLESFLRGFARRGESLVKAVTGDVLAFAAGTPLPDDITLVSLEAR